MAAHRSEWRRTVEAILGEAKDKAATEPGHVAGGVAGVPHAHLYRIKNAWNVAFWREQCHEAKELIDYPHLPVDQVTKECKRLKIPDEECYTKVLFRDGKSDVPSHMIFLDPPSDMARSHIAGRYKLQLEAVSSGTWRVVAGVGAKNSRTWKRWHVTTGTANDTVDRFARTKRARGKMEALWAPLQQDLAAAITTHQAACAVLQHPPTGIGGAHDTLTKGDGEQLSPGESETATDALKAAMGATEREWAEEAAAKPAAEEEAAKEEAMQAVAALSESHRFEWPPPWRSPPGAAHGTSQSSVAGVLYPDLQNSSPAGLSDLSHSDLNDLGQALAGPLGL